MFEPIEKIERRLDSIDFLHGLAMICCSTTRANTFAPPEAGFPLRVVYAAWLAGLVMLYRLGFGVAKSNETVAVSHSAVFKVKFSANKNKRLCFVIKQSLLFLSSA